MRMHLEIFDVSPMLYAGQKGLSKSGYNASANTLSNGIPIGGIRYTLRRAVTDLYRGYDVLFVFDSKTDKNKFYDGYKSNRTRDPDIYIQQMMFEDIVRNCNLPYLKQDNFEADDLVAYAMSQIKYEYTKIAIVTSDMDLAANICTSGTTLLGASSSIPEINKDNFAQTVKSNCIIEYNMILPYYMFFGKPSNNVKPFKDKATNMRLLSDFGTFCRNNNIPEGQRSLINPFAQWLQYLNTNALLSDDDISELLHRTQYIYPRMVKSELNYDIKNIHNCFDDFNQERLAFFLKTLNLDSLITDFNLQDLVGPTKTREMFAYADAYKDLYTQGVLAVDADTTPDMSHFSSGEGTSTVFVDEGDF